MPLENFSESKTSSDKRNGRRYKITTAHGTGSLTEGSKTYGQMKTSTVYTGGESGMKEGSRVKKVEFLNNTTEQRKRETQYFDSGRKVTRFEDRVEVVYGDGKITDPQQISKEIYYKGGKKTTYMGDGRVVVEEKFSNSSGSKQRETTYYKPIDNNKLDLSRRVTRYDDRVEVSYGDDSKEIYKRATTENLEIPTSETELIRTEAFNIAKTEIDSLLDILRTSESIAEIDVPDLSEPEVSLLYNESLRSKISTQELKSFIQRLTTLNQKYRFLTESLNVLQTELEIDPTFNLEQELRFAANRYNIENAKKWPFRSEDVIQSLRLQKEEREKELEIAKKKREELRELILSYTNRLDELSKAGSFNRQERILPFVEKLSREYLERVVRDTVEKMPESEAIDSLFVKCDSNEITLDSAITPLQYHDFLKTQLKVATKNKINILIRQSFENQNSSDFVIKPFELYDLDSKKPNLTDAVIISSLYRNPDVSILFGDSKLIKNKYDDLRNQYISMAIKGLLDPATKFNTENDPRIILSSYFKDKTSLKLNFVNAIYLDRVYQRDILDSLSESDISDLKSFFGEDQFNRYYNYIQSLSNYQTTERETLESLQSLIQNIKNKYLNETSISSADISTLSPSEYLESLMRSIPDQNYEPSIKNNFSISVQKAATTVLNSPELDVERKKEFIHTAISTFIREPLKSDRGIESVLAVFESLDPEELLKIYPNFLEINDSVIKFMKNIYQNPSGYYSPYILDTRMWKLLNYLYGDKLNLYKTEGLESSTRFLHDLNEIVANTSYHSPYDTPQSSIYSFLQDILSTRSEVGENILYLSSLLPSGTTFKGNIYDLQFFRRQDLKINFPYVFTHPEQAREYLLKLVDLKNVKTYDFFNLLQEANSHIEQIKKSENE